ncbi:sugar phosphate isomerase/epimerase [Roseomonas sp. AR75]|uniref:sugar phosphate isomerase/epimerase family protein n=1 Tax=Roseomonas sp. AR75 TaxID=2562311 RepID=UPI0010BFB5E6|nr:TIM barrel protein [Roseomonas sp. AR75]
MNPLCVHPLVFIPRWTRDAGPRAIERAAVAGFDMMIVPGRDPSEVDVRDIVRRAEAAGLLLICNTNHPPESDPASDDPAIAMRGAARLLDAVRLARDLGARQLGGLPHAAWGKAAGPVTPRGRAHAVAALARAADLAAASGLRITLECVNRFENALVNTAADGLALIAEVGAPNILLHLDTHHMLIEEADPPRVVAEAVPQLGFLEFSESHRGPLGAGNVDLSAIIAAAQGYDGPIGFEAFSAAILDPALAAHLCVWRNTYTDADAVARDAARRLRAALQER